MSAPRRNDRPAALALIGISLLFIVIVGRGWQGLFVPLGLTISIFVGLVVALIATILAYAIANERVHQPHSLAAAAAYFFVLINISALGTVNAMFVTFQAANVFREEIEKAQGAVNQLRDAGGQYLGNQLASFDKFTGRVNDHLKALTDEIENPNLCGQGPVAARHAQALQDILPNFRTLAGGGDCRTAKEAAEIYRKKVPDLVRTSKEYATDKDAIELRARLMRESDQMIEMLQSTYKMLGANASIQTIKSNLFETAEQYSLLRQQFRSSMFPRGSQVPERIDTSAISALGDIGQVVPFLLSRLQEISTYVYLIIALVLDVTVIAAFARVIRSGPDPRHKSAVTAPRHL